MENDDNSEQSGGPSKTFDDSQSHQADQSRGSDEVDGEPKSSNYFSKIFDDYNSSTSNRDVSYSRNFSIKKNPSTAQSKETDEPVHNSEYVARSVSEIVKKHIDKNDSSVKEAISLLKRFNELEELINIRPTMFQGHSINCEILIDLLNAIYYECQRSGLTRNKHQQKFLEFITPYVEKVNRLRIKSSDFDIIKVIGFGNFGQVSVVKSKDGSIYAMKTLNKIEMLRRAETACYREERDVLLHGGSHDWFTKLHYAFQDETNLYLIMNYYVGGDLLTLLSKYDDFLPENLACFYSAQIISAISVLHDMGYIHRDIKPDNVLLDSHGHARLADFGSCIKVSNVTTDGICTIAVGTPDYISPDVLKAMEEGRNSGLLYSYDVDWWSLGVVIFESLFGETPFYAESLVETYSRIMNHEICFKFPDEPNVSDQVRDLISHLICNKKDRFSTLDQFKSHKWFENIDWDNLRYAEPPYKPVVSGPADTSNFDIDDLRPPNENYGKNGHLQGIGAKTDSMLNLHLPFVGFSATFSAIKYDRCNKNSSDETLETNLVKKVDEPIENLTVANDLSGPNKYHDTKEISTMTDLETLASSFIFNHVEAGTLDGSSQSIDASGLVSSPSMDNSSSNDGERIAQLEADLKLARQQWSDLSVIVNDIRKEKTLLSNRLRESETELEVQIEKMAEMRKTMAIVDKARRQQAEEIICLQKDLEKERQVRHNCHLEISSLENKCLSLQNEKLALIQPRPPSRLEDQDYQSIHSNGHNTNETLQQQRDYINHLEEQVLRLQQQQPNWERQVAAAVSHGAIDQIDYSLKTSPDYTKDTMRSSTVSRKLPKIAYRNTLHDESVLPEVSGHTTWQERRSARVERHELKELQLSLQNELEDKRRVQNELEEKKRQLCQALADLAETKLELSRVHSNAHKEAASNISILNQPAIDSNLFNHHDNTLGSHSEASVKTSSTSLKQPSIDQSVSYNNSSNSYQNKQSIYYNRSGFSSSSADEYLEADAVYKNTKQNYKQNLSSQIDTKTVARVNDAVSCNYLDKAISTRPLNLSMTHNQHMFVVRTFIVPLKCSLCTSLMIGLVRQGLVCESCGFACHVNCAQSLGSLVCPHDDRRPTGLDPQRGIGTAYSGYVRIPRPGGIRKGWLRIYVVVCDFKLFLYDINNELSGSSSSGVSLVGSDNRDENSIYKNPSVSVNRVIDLRDENFSVTSVLESDVIHANKTDLACIFRLTTSMIGDGACEQRYHQLMLVDKESEKNKWIEALHELHRIVKRNNLPSRNYLQAYSFMTTAQLTLLRNINSINCCCLVDEGTRLLIGSDDSLTCCYLDVQAYHKLPKGKRVMLLAYLANDQLVVSMSGRQRHIKVSINNNNHLLN